MNRHSLVLFLTISVVSFLSSGSLSGAVFGDFEYSDTGTSITITYYNGTGGNIVIPDTIDGKPVTVIGSSAFYNKVKTNSTLTLPSTLTTIGAFAFMGCWGFTGSLTIPEGVTTIVDSAFSGCSGIS